FLLRAVNVRRRREGESASSLGSEEAAWARGAARGIQPFPYGYTRSRLWAPTSPTRPLGPVPLTPTRLLHKLKPGLHPLHRGSGRRADPSGPTPLFRQRHSRGDLRRLAEHLPNDVLAIALRAAVQQHHIRRETRGAAFDD